MQPPDLAQLLAGLAEKHQSVLASPESCRRMVKQLAPLRRGGGAGSGRLRWLLGLSWRLAVVWAFCSASLLCLEGTFPALSHAVRAGRPLSYLNLVYLKSYRWLSVQLGLYRSELLHSRDRESCLVPNPLYRPPAMCCGCQQPARIPHLRLNNPSGRDAFRRSLDRHLNPFVVADSGHRPVTYAELRLALLANWEDVQAGSNRISVQAPTEGAGPATLAELLRHPERPPAARMSRWMFGHMPAIRVVRRLLARPPFVRPDTEQSFARSVDLFAGPPGEESPLGDLAEFDGAVLLLDLHGSVRVTLTAKTECCHSNEAAEFRNASAMLEPGQALVVPSQCYRVHAARLAAHGDGGYAMVHALSLFSSTGIKQPAPITGRVPVTDNIEDDN